MQDDMACCCDYWICVRVEGCEMSLLMVVFYLFLQIVMGWLDHWTSVYQLQWWYFADVL